MRFDSMIKEISFNEENRDDVICQDILQYKAGWEVWMQAYRKSLLDKYNIMFDESIKYAEDIPFTVETLLYADRWIKLPDILYNYTYRRQSLSVISNEDIISKMSGVRTGICNILDGKYSSGKADEMKKKYVSSLMSYINR